MRIPKQEDVAILFMSELAKHRGERLVSLSEIARSHGLSVLFLKKIARLLRHARLIKSKEGSGGGYRLAHNAARISVWDIMQAFSRRQYDVPSLLVRRNTCPVFSACLPQKVERTLSDAMEKSFRTITLASLAGGSAYETQK